LHEVQTITLVTSTDSSRAMQSGNNSDRQDECLWLPRRQGVVKSSVTDLLSWFTIDSRSLTIVVCASDGFDVDVDETVVFTFFFFFPKKFIILETVFTCSYRNSNYRGLLCEMRA